ncbi:MAG: tetratricopeptide repeat protein [Candidatus Aminicenantes bacterium]|nr:tetratricopeptide repeat protein [Candidatus Aminicenantes bacterium]
MKKTPALCLLGAVVLCLAGVPADSAQEVDVEKALSRGDAAFEKSEYKEAIVAYFEAAALSTKPENLSRAYFGLSLSYFYQRDMAESVKWMRKISLVDPLKRISEDSYPKPFVDLFNQVMAEARAKGTPVAAPDQKSGTPPGKTEPEKTETGVPPVKGGISKEDIAPAGRPAEAPKLRVVEAPVKGMPLGGRLELSVHYSSWTLDPVTALLEDSLNEELGGAIQDEINDELNSRYPGLVPGPFTSDMKFDSEGANYGIELRYYVRGRLGTFSLGVSFEQTNIKFTLAGTARQEFTNGGAAVAEARAAVETKPFSTNISFRWEMGRPTARVKPYFVFGFGFAPLQGTFDFNYTATYTLGPFSDTIQDAQSKTFPELSEDLEFEIPDFLFIVQLHFGLKIEIIGGLFIQGEAGFWNGLILRGGLGYRF